MEITQKTDANNNYVPVSVPEKTSTAIVNEDDVEDNAFFRNDHQQEDQNARPPPPPPSSSKSSFQSLTLGLLSASPTLLLIGFGANASIGSICIYIGLLLMTSLCAQYASNNIQSGIVRWVLGLVLVGITSSFKSGSLLASCDNAVMKAVLYAVTALWECSNAVLVIGGRDLFQRYNIGSDINHVSSRDIILSALAPCQVKFIHQNTEGFSRFGAVDVNNYCSPGGRTGRRSIHITSCAVGVASMYFLLVKVQPIQTVITSFILFELEYMALMASMAVVVLDIPSHLWQIIHDMLALTKILGDTTNTTPEVILPYGWIYSSNSTRQFWSRWSRPGMQLIRHLFYYPLGGRNRWYISIPIMFLLNAFSHFDLSYALVGDRAEVYWIAIFGTLAIVAMLEVAGDKLFGIDIAVDNEDGSSNHSVSFPMWYTVARATLAHASLRFVMYIMIYKCFHSSLSQLFIPIGM